MDPIVADPIAQDNKRNNIVLNIQIYGKSLLKCAEGGDILIFCRSLGHRQLGLPVADMTLVATIHFSPFTGNWLTDFLFTHSLFCPQQEGSLSPFTYYCLRIAQFIPQTWFRSTITEIIPALIFAVFFTLLHPEQISSKKNPQ